jgi:hypothetical protein
MAVTLIRGFADLQNLMARLTAPIPPITTAKGASGPQRGGRWLLQGDPLGGAARLTREFRKPSAPNQGLMRGTQVGWIDDSGGDQD